VEAQRSCAVLVGGNNYLSPPLPTQASPKQKIGQQLIVMKTKCFISWAPRFLSLATNL
jgi:hypothetical protein